MLALGAVAGAEALEVVPLHDTGVALALAGADDIDQGAGLEGLGGDLLAERVLARVGRAQLDGVAPRRDAGLGEVARLGLVHPARVDRAVGQLDGDVAVGLLGSDLGHHVGSGLDHGDRDDPVVLVEYLGHPELLAQDPGDLPVSHRLVSPTGCSRRRWPAGRCA